MIPDVQSHFETPKKIGPTPQKSYDFLITLVVIMFLSGGYAIWFISTYLYAYDDADFAYTPRVHRASASQIATSTVDMTDWQTYRNEEYGFEFMYPNLGGDTQFNKIINIEGIQLIGTSPHQNIKTARSGNFYIYLSENKNKLPLEKWFLEDSPDNYLLIQNKNYQISYLPNGNAVLKLENLPLPKEFDKLGPIVGYSYLIHPYNNIVLGFKVGGHDSSLYEYEAKELEDQILSTFKFLQ